MLYVIFGILMVFWAWMQAAMGKLQKYKKDARAQWVRVDALLRTRSQYILELLALADEKGLDAGELLAEIYELGGGYCRSDDREVISACAEDVTPLLDQLLVLAYGYQPLKEDEAFHELDSSLTELDDEIEIQSDRYNHFIDLYNQHREKSSVHLQMMILGAIPLKGIHIRSKSLTLPGSEEEKA